MKYINKEKKDNKNNKLKVGSLFAGVGGICQAFKDAGFDVVWANEIDPSACKTCECNHKNTHLFAKSIEDLTKEELGDILFAVVNLARWNKIDAEQALLKANKKFISRFKEMEKLADKELEHLTLEEWDTLWKKAKKELS